VLEVGELVREAAIREAREETGLYDRVLRDAGNRVQYRYVLIAFLPPGCGKSRRKPATPPKSAGSQEKNFRG
jgi:8-oxo-dGTP pyrophosphatase MutT (NUDIX family)